jgi:hypothetical protein
MCPRIYNLDLINLQETPYYYLDLKHGSNEKKEKYYRLNNLNIFDQWRYFEERIILEMTL